MYRRNSTPKDGIGISFLRELRKLEAMLFSQEGRQVISKKAEWLNIRGLHQGVKDKASYDGGRILGRSP